MQTTTAITPEKTTAIEYSVLWFTYLMHILVVPAFLGALINFIKTTQFNRNTKEGKTVSAVTKNLNDHHLWLERTFFVMILSAMASIGTAYYAFGFLFAAVAITWWVYRIFRGIYALIMHKNLPITI